MIKTEYGYQKSLFWLKEFEAILEDDKKKYLPHKPDHFKILAGGTISQIEDLKKEIAEYENQYLKKAG